MSSRRREFQERKVEKKGQGRLAVRMHQELEDCKTPAHAPGTRKKKAQECLALRKKKETPTLTGGNGLGRKVAS